MRFAIFPHLADTAVTARHVGWARAKRHPSISHRMDEGFRSTHPTSSSLLSSERSDIRDYVRRSCRPRTSLGLIGLQAFSRRGVDGAGDPNGHERSPEVMVKHGGQKYRSDDQIIISHVKTRTSLTTVAARFAMIRVSRGSRTEFLASALFLAVAAGATIVKARGGAETPAVGGACSGQLEPSGAAWHRSQLSTSARLD